MPINDNQCYSITMYKTAGVSFDSLAEKLLIKLLKHKEKIGEPMARSPYLCRLVVEEAKRLGLFNDKK